MNRKLYKFFLRGVLFFTASPRNIVRIQQKRVKHQIKVVYQLKEECEEAYVKMMLGKMIVKLKNQQEELKEIKKKYPLFGIKFSHKKA